MRGRIDKEWFGWNWLTCVLALIVLIVGGVMYWTSARDRRNSELFAVPDGSPTSCRISLTGPAVEMVGELDAAEATQLWDHYRNTPEEPDCFDPKTGIVELASESIMGGFWFFFPGGKHYFYDVCRDGWMVMEMNGEKHKLDKSIFSILEEMEVEVTSTPDE